MRRKEAVRMLCPLPIAKPTVAHRCRSTLKGRGNALAARQEASGGLQSVAIDPTDAFALLLRRQCVPALRLRQTRLLQLLPTPFPAARRFAPAHWKVVAISSAGRQSIAVTKRSPRREKR